jgi:uncharacterized protein DUF5719
VKGSERAFVVLFVAVVVAAIAGDRFLPQSPAPASRARMRVASAAGAAYCPVPNAEEARSFAATVNVGEAPANLRHFAIGEGKASNPQPASLPPKAVNHVDAGTLGIREGAAVVESFASPTFTDSVVLARGVGAATAPCTGQPGTRWLFASGSTVRGNDTYLLVSNPFQEDASVGVRLLTAEGPAALPRLREYTIRPLSETVIFLADFHPENDSFGIDVTVSRGRLVVSRLMRLAPRGGPRGLALSLGVREPAARWQFAAGEVPGEGEELINLANPGDKEALVQIVFQAEGEQVAPRELEEVPVAAGAHVAVKVSDRLPRGTKHGTTVLSTNGVPIVAERQTAGPSGGLRGLEAVAGATATASRWLVQTGTPIGGTAQLAIVNTGREDTQVAVSLMTPQGQVRPPELAAVPVGAGRRISLDLTPYLGGEPAAAVVEGSTDDVVAEGRMFLGDPYLDFADAPARPLP